MATTMRTRWEDSTYYTRLEDLINLRIAGLSNREFIDKSMQLADEELATDMWLRSHFNSTAEFLAECETLDDALHNGGFTIDEMFEMAEREVQLMKKYGMNWQRQREIVDEARERFS